MPGIIFDLDGTLFDSEPVHGKAIREALAPLGLSVEDEWYVGLPDREAIRRAFREGGKSVEDSVVQAVIAEKSRLYRARVQRGELHPYEGSLELIHVASEQLAIGLCTAAPRADATSMLRAAEIEHRFRTTVCSEDVEKGKPDPACYALCAARLELTPGECIAIEDSVHGVAAAKDAGLRVIAVGHTMSKAKLARADAFVDHIRELSVERISSMFGA